MSWSGHCQVPGQFAPVDLIGIPYRLGADPLKHGATDCVNLCRTVLAWYGINTPAPTRQWYRRLRDGDTAVFWEELESWGYRTTTAAATTVALLKIGTGYGLAAYYEEGWLYCNAQMNRVAWSPFVSIEAVYCPGKSN